MLSQIFYAHGHFCASHPWEVIVAFLTLTVSMLSLETSVTSNSNVCEWSYHCSVSEESKGAEVVFMTATRCMALLYVYHQFRSLYKLGSKYLIGIAALFTVFSSFVFSSSVVNFLHGNFAELKEALPFFLLLIDFSRAGVLAKFAMSSSTQDDVRQNIAQGMAILGPTVTLDTIVETLVIGVGTLSGVKRLEEMCCFACMSAIVNYVVFMTFFPAFLSLVLELSRNREEGQPGWHLSSLTKVLNQEAEKPNPVLQKVKVIMSAGLVLVHTHSRWPLIVATKTVLEHRANLPSPTVDDKIFPSQDESLWNSHIQRWLAVSSGEIFMLAFACFLIAVYMFFENRDELTEHLASVMTSTPRNTAEGSIRAFNMFGSFPLIDLSKLANRDKASLSKETDECLQSEQKKCNKEVQTEETNITDERKSAYSLSSNEKKIPCLRPVKECLEILHSQNGSQSLTNEEIIRLVQQKYIAPYKLESVLENPERGVFIRRQLISKAANCEDALNELPFCHYDYSSVMGACCENVIGYVPVPVGVAGPLLLDGKEYHVPLATTEGCLVASTNRGCRAIYLSGGVKSSVVGDGMTRGPVIRLPSVQEAVEVMTWVQQKENFDALKTSFDSTSRFARLQKIDIRICGRFVFLRFVATTGDAMGMNMLSKGTEKSLRTLQGNFPSVEILSISGNYCTDKKPAAVNWIEGRGKSVVCEAEISSKVVKEVLKTTVKMLIEVNISKNLVGSAMAGSVGGFNAQAANIVTAIFIATGQDPAQNVSSSNCITLMQPCGPDGQNLHISCTMPSIEIGTVGGGTVLSPQAACLKLLGVQGPAEVSGENASTLARIVCGTVLAGELSLMSALAAGHLVHSHLTHNRSSQNITSLPPSLSSEDNISHPEGL